MKLTFKAVYGENSKSSILWDKGISITLFDTYMLLRTNYGYRQLNEDTGVYEEMVCNEKTYIRRSAIDSISAAYDAKEDINYLYFVSYGKSYWLNVESAEIANDSLNILFDWLFGDV